MIGLAGPVTRSPHHGISTAWFSIATKSLSVEIMCTAAMQPTGEPAKWMTVWIPYMEANSEIRLLSRMAPDDSGSDMDQVHGVVLNQRTEPFLQAKKALAGVDGRDGRFLDFLVGAPVPGSVPGTEGAHLEQILGPGQFILSRKSGRGGWSRSHRAGRSGQPPEAGPSRWCRARPE